MKTVLKCFLMLIFLITQFAGIKLTAQECTDANTLASYKNTKVGSYEYAVFIFNTPTEFTYSVSSVSPPFTFDPSEEPVTIPGSRFRKITFSKINWLCESANNVLIIPGRKIKGLEMVEQFEGVISLVVGYRSNVSYQGTYYYYSGGKKYIVMRFR